MTPPRHRRWPRLRRSLRAPGLLFALLVGATAVATFFTVVQVDSDREEAVERRANDAVDAIERRFAAYSEVVYGTRGLFESPRPVTRQLFRQYARSLAVQSRFPGLQALAFAERVEAFERPSYEAAVRRDGRRSESPYPAGFRVHPVGTRNRHVVVSYVEPVEGNHAAVGLDLLFERRRRAAIERTQETGRLVMTAPLDLVVRELGGRRTRGVLILLAARNVAGPLADPATGRFEGTVAGAVDMREFMADVFREARDFELQVYDTGPTSGTEVEPTTANLAYDTNDNHAALRGVDPGEATMTTVQLGGRRWAIHYEARTPLISGAEARAPWVVAGAGLILSVLAAALMYAIATRREQAEALAADMTADLRRSREELERSNQELEEFAYVASHDLKEPLRVVSGFVELLQRFYAGRLDDRADEFIQATLRGVDRMQAMIDALLDYSRVGRASVGAETVDCDEAVRDARLNLHRLIAERHAELHVGELPRIPGEPSLIAQLFQNLISNAVKYGDAEHPSVDVRARRSNGDWCFSVEDNGGGLDPEQAERVFEMFKRFQADEQAGTGIGLAICKRIVEKHGGHIWVEPRETGGSAFRFTIPAGPRAG